MGWGASPGPCTGQSASLGTAKSAGSAGDTKPRCQSDVAHISGIGAAPVHTV